MSLINRMLQDLDRRQALGTAGERPWCGRVGRQAGGREWFWRVLAVLLTASARLDGLGGYPAAAAQAARHRARAFGAARRAAAHAEPSRAAPAPTPRRARGRAGAARQPRRSPRAAPAAAAVRRDAAPGARDCRRRSLETPPAASRRRPKPTKPAAAKPKPAPRRPSRQGSVDKRDAHAYGQRQRRGAFPPRRAAAEPGPRERGRGAAASPRCRPTRARRGAPGLRLAAARAAARATPRAALLQEALALNPGAADLRARAGAHPRAAARLRRRAGGHGPRRLGRRSNADFQALRGAMLQRLGRARRSGRGLPERGARRRAAGDDLGRLRHLARGARRRSEAAQAYRRALDAGPIAAEAREYAESRARALE